MKKRKPDARKPAESFKFNPFRVGSPGRKKGYFRVANMVRSRLSTPVVDDLVRHSG